MDEEKWSTRVEIVALVSFSVSMLHCFSVAAYYNVSIALFALYSTYTRNGRINLSALYIVLVSLFIDIVYLGLYGKIDIDLKEQYSWGVAMMIINMFIKVALVVCQYFLFVEYGAMYGLHFPVGSFSSSQNNTKAYSSEPFQSQSSPHVTYPVNTGSGNNSSGGYQGIDV